MDIDWDTPARLDAYHIVNAPHSLPPPVGGTLRQCLEAVADWPTTAVPVIHTDIPVQGYTVFDGDMILKLLRTMRDI